MTEDTNLRAAVIGCGLAATWRHIPCLMQIPGVDLVCVCDRDLERAKKVAGDFGIASVYADAKEMMQNESLDLVHVLTLPETHLELALQAMDAGCNVLIEKPFVDTVAEADRAIAKAKQTKTRFTVIHNDVFTPAMAEVKARVKAGELGEIVSVQFLAARRDQRSVANPWYYESYGGRMGETLPHALCLLVELIPGLEVIHVDARKLGHCIPPEGVQDSGIDELHVLLASESANALGKISYGFNSNLPDSLIICGTKGNLLAHPNGNVTRLPFPEPGVRDSAGIAKRVVDRVLQKLKLRKKTKGQKLTQSGHYHQIRGFVQSLRDGTEPGVTEAKAREVVALQERIVETYWKPASSS